MYRPRYVAAAAALDRLTTADRAGDATAGLAGRRTAAEQRRARAVEQASAAAAEAAVFAGPGRDRAGWRPVTLSALFAAGFTLAGVGRLAAPAARRGLVRGGAGFMTLGLTLTAATVLGPPPGPVTSPVAGLADRPAPAVALPDVDAEDPPAAGPPPPADAAVPFVVSPKFSRAAPKPAARSYLLPPAAAAALGRGTLPPAPGFRPPRLSGGPATKLATAAGPGTPAAAAVAAAWTRVQRAAGGPPPVVVREYAYARPDQPAAGSPAETLLWKPVVVAPDTGRVTLPFDLPAGQAGYRVVVAGHTLTGRVGAAVTTIRTREPFAVTLKLPPEVGAGDAPGVRVGLANRTPDPVAADVVVSAGGPDWRATVTVPAGGGTRVVVPDPVALDPAKPDGAEVRVAVETDGPGGRRAAFGRQSARLTVVPAGFPAAGAAGAVLEPGTPTVLTVTLPAGLVPGSVAVTATAYPTALADALAGLDGLLAEPHGCFEQTSATNYPNVLVLKYARQAGGPAPDAAGQARRFLDAGYAKLVGFECPKTGSADKQGFEWFGAADRPHEALSAYGLMQFADMAAVYPVDPAVVARTRAYLLSTRDGHGGFRRAPSRHGFGRVTDATHAAYVTWALTEADKAGPGRTDLAAESTALVRLAADPAADPYFLALTAGALLNRGDRPAAKPLVARLAELQAKAGTGGVPGAAAGVTLSGGADLVTETTGLALLAFAAAGPEFATPADLAARFLATRRTAGGAFGGTQATVLALKALTAHAAAPAANPAGTLVVRVGGAEVGRAPLTGPGPVAVPLGDLSRVFPNSAGAVTVSVESSAAVPVLVSWTGRTTTPPADPACPVKLTTKLARAVVAEGQSVRLGVTVTNPGPTPQGMTVAVVGLPAGLTLPPDRKQLKALTARPADGADPAVAYYETRGRELILYWRGLAAGRTVAFDLDLLAEYPGTFTGPAGRVYRYYDAAAKDWAAPLAVTVE